MSKTKSQLRAEAVERLRKLNCMDVDCYQLLEATVDDDGEKVGYRVEISKLIDLLTDDAHESRGSYEERLHDVPVSDCPYCGCKRVVIHDFSDIYENPHSYRVEHVDEKEAFNAGCFETYYSFDSVEKAVEHANMRGLLTDDEPPEGDAVSELRLWAEIDQSHEDSEHVLVERRIMSELADMVERDYVRRDSLTDEEPRKFGVTAEQMAKASADFFDNLPSVNGKNGDFLPTTAEDEDANCKKADSLQDSREKLEAEIRYEYNGRIEWEADQIIGWLDRQAAITTQECTDVYETGCEACRSAQKRKIAELQERVDNLCASEEIGNKLIMAQLETEAERGRTIVEYAERVGELEAENARLREHAEKVWCDCDCCKWQEEREKLQAKCDGLQAKVDALEAENARLRSRISDDAEYGRLVMGEYRDLRAKVDELTEERDTYRDNMKSLEWRADRLEAELRDTEGQLKTQRHNALQAQDALRIRREKHEASRMEYVELQAENAKLREKLDEIAKVVER